MNFRAVLLAAALLAAAPGHAAQLTVKVRTPDGEPYSQVVVLVDPLPRPVSEKSPPGTAIVDQVNRAFDPFVSVIRTGTAVNFPNRDDIRHHVYSFSDAKTFELPLYKGTPAEPVVFDQPGIVTLACNIHDWMLAFVYVTDAQWFAVSGDDGNVVFDLPDRDEYRVTVWHPGFDPDNPGRATELARDGRAALEYTIELDPTDQPASRRLRRGSGRYR